MKPGSGNGLAAAGDRLLVLQLVRVLGAVAILAVPLLVGDAPVGLLPLALVMTSSRVSRNPLAASRRGGAVGTR